MKKDIADRWVMALRSGGYKQSGSGTHTVFLHRKTDHRGNRFSCIGVLCYILAEEVGVKRTETEEGAITYDILETELLDRVMEYADINADTDISQPIRIPSLNSSIRKLESTHSFKELSHIIEKRYKEI